MSYTLITWKFDHTNSSDNLTKNTTSNWILNIKFKKRGERGGKKEEVKEVTHDRKSKVRRSRLIFDYIFPKR